MPAKLNKRPDETDLQYRSRLADARAIERAKDEPLVTPEAARHGDYREDDGRFRGSGKMNATVNRGGSTIERWLARGDPFFKPQNEAVRLCQALWLISEGKSHLVREMKLGAGWTPLGWSEHEAQTEINGFKRRIPPRQWDVFEKICRRELTGADAGHMLSANPRDAAIAAKHTTANVASLVAMWRGL